MPTPLAFDPTEDDRRILTEATVNAAQALELSSAELARILGVSEATVSRMRHGRYQLDPASKAWEIALLLIRLYRGLGAIMGHDHTVMLQWIDNPNTDLGEPPRTMLRRIDGLAEVVAYLDAHRAPL